MVKYRPMVSHILFIGVLLGMTTCLLDEADTRSHWLYLRWRKWANNHVVLQLKLIFLWIQQLKNILKNSHPLLHKFYAENKITKDVYWYTQWNKQNIKFGIRNAHQHPEQPHGSTKSVNTLSRLTHLFDILLKHRWAWDLGKFPGWW